MFTFLVKGGYYVCHLIDSTVFLQEESCLYGSSVPWEVFTHELRLFSRSLFLSFFQTRRFIDSYYAIYTSTNPRFSLNIRIYILRDFPDTFT